MTHDKGPRLPEDNDESRNLDESELRDQADYLKAIGDEETGDQIVEEGLEEYGFDKLDDSHFESEPTAASDNPDWMTEEALKRANADFPHNRNPDDMYSDDQDSAEPEADEDQ